MSQARELAENASQLFSLPDIYFQLCAILKDDSSDLNDVVQLIEMDAALTARLLRVANSAFYQFPAEIKSISRAVNLIGTRELSNLVLATCVASAFKHVPESVIDMDHFWGNNMDVALIALNLGQQIEYSEPDVLFVSGLLHNLGELVVLQDCPEQAHQALLLEGNELPWERQLSVLGFTFADCSAELLDIWQLPTDIVETVRYQHNPDQAVANPLAAALLHLACRTDWWLDEGSEEPKSICAEALARTELNSDNLKSAAEFARFEALTFVGAISGSLY